ncbi:MAG: tRNA (5-methylaminomethyl-2-thiouridylate)-methyltransferase [Burkholderiaceae bacterium]|jgi:tRNA 5-methylaminomethyl-2-thiouridine biosynthesis bifunctional protein|nr:MAG: tRNA (5-methylaminomethyl-2-thiouridylate)-methyltransferase [Burkholderiaceae bacterium]
MNALQPAHLLLAADGVPRSAIHGDVYHSADGGPGQAAHVFLAGNDLPGRWHGRERFVVLEIGFGLGLNFLTTWRAWRNDTNAPRRLDYIAVEKHPPATADLTAVHAQWPALGALSKALRAQWPPPVAGFHRLPFNDDAVALTLLLGDAREYLPQIDTEADAIYLDGFAPDRNPELWSSELCAQLARLARPGATLATWSVAGDVRRRLAAAGFVLEKRPGFGRKREMLHGRRSGIGTRERSKRD